MFFNNNYCINSIVYDLKFKNYSYVHNYFGYVSGKTTYLDFRIADYNFYPRKYKSSSCLYIHYKYLHVTSALLISIGM